LLEAREFKKVRAEVSSRKPELVLQTGHSAKPANLVFSPDSSLVAFLDEVWTMKLWDVLTGRILRSFQEVGTKDSDLAFSRDSSELAIT